MFTFDPRPEILLTVPIALPGHEPAELKVRCAALPDDEIDGFDLQGEDGSDALIDAVVLGFPDVVDDDGKPIADDAALKAAMLKRRWIKAPIVQRYFLALSGARLGN
jgi:hypothetical protein